MCSTKSFTNCACSSPNPVRSLVPFPTANSFPSISLFLILSITLALFVDTHVTTKVEKLSVTISAFVNALLLSSSKSAFFSPVKLSILSVCSLKCNTETSTLSFPLTSIGKTACLYSNVTVTSPFGSTSSDVS